MNKKIIDIIDRTNDLDRRLVGHMSSGYYYDNANLVNTIRSIVFEIRNILLDIEELKAASEAKCE